MLNFAALFLPCFVCLIWAGMLVFTPHKGASRKVLMVLLLTLTTYFFTDAFYVGQLEDTSDYKLLVRLDVVSQFVTMAIVPFLVLFLTVAQGKMFSWPIAYLSLMPCVCQGVASVVIYMVMGVDNAVDYIQASDMLGAFPPEYDMPIYHAHMTVCRILYNAVLSLEIVGGLGYLIFVFVRNRKNTELTSIVSLVFVLMVICAFRIILGRYFLVSHAGLSSVLSALMALDLFFVCHIAVGLRPNTGSKQSMLLNESLARINSRAPYKEDEDTDEPVVIEHPSSREQTDLYQPSKPKNLLESFIVYMANEQPYLNPDLSVQDVCEELHTNRTYISELMADNFKMSFRDYIGILRISTAKKLLRENPTRTLEDIASDSGFASSSQFVKKFKEITGLTPRAWLASQI